MKGQKILSFLMAFVFPLIFIVLLGFLFGEFWVILGYLTQCQAVMLGIISGVVFGILGIIRYGTEV